MRMERDTYRTSRDELAYVSSHLWPEESICYASIHLFKPSMRRPCEGSVDFFHQVEPHGRGYAETIPSRVVAKENESVFVSVVILESERRLVWE